MNNANTKFPDSVASTGYGGDQPSLRSLRVFSFDPSASKELRTSLINEVTIKTSWSDVIGPGPVGEYIEVIDYDPASQCYYRPVDLNHPNILATGGLSPSEADPQFHQQMVYAVVMATIGHFEQALGRAVLWSTRVVRDTHGNFEKKDFVQRLRIYPHAFRGANAYYSPAKKALLFGYFAASDNSPDQVTPGSTVFTCLSHDIIVHETTHAILDGMHPRFAERTNPDVLALHEGFADIVALFQHFSFPEVLHHQIAETRGNLSTESLLVVLARQFGIAIGGRGALRSAIGTPPDPLSLRKTEQVHKRGAILVAAVFDAFLAVYQMKTADLLRLSTQGSGVLAAGNLSPDLVTRLSAEAADTARHILHMCIRAMDYVPPVDVTFGDFLRGLITADFDVDSSEQSIYRTALLESFRRRGINPKGLSTVSTTSLLWPVPQDAKDFSVSFPRLAFAFESGSVGEQKQVDADIARYQVLDEVQNSVRLLVKNSGANLHDIGRIVSDANTPFVALNDQLVRGGSVVSSFQKWESLTDSECHGKSAIPNVNFSLEWGVEGNRENKNYISQQNCEQFYLTWVKHWALYNPSWAENELGLALFAAEHLANGTNGYKVHKMPRGIYFSSGKNEKSLPAYIPSVEVHSFRLARRRGPRGDYLTELVVEVTQRRRGFFDEERQRRVDDGTEPINESDRGDFTVRGGCTLMIDPRNASNSKYGIRRVIKKGSILDPERIKEYRRFLRVDDGSLRASYFGMPRQENDEETFAILHADIE